MSPQIIFAVQSVCGYLAWLLCFSVYVLPKLKTMQPLEAQRAIATLHSFRFFGLVEKAEAVQSCDGTLRFQRLHRLKLRQDIHTEAEQPREVTADGLDGEDDLR